MAEKKFNQREEALTIIKNGQAVMLKVDGRKKIFSADNVEELPTEADLAIGNPELSRLASADIDAEIERLQLAKKRLAEADKEGKELRAESLKAESKEETKEEAPKTSAKKEESK